MSQYTVEQDDQDRLKDEKKVLFYWYTVDCSQD